MNIPNENLVRICKELCITTQMYKAGGFDVSDDEVDARYDTVALLFGIRSYVLNSLVRNVISDKSIKESNWGDKLLSNVRETLNASR